MKKQIGLFTAILFAVSIAMMACKAEVHTHTFAEEWTNDEINHWHASTCGHTTEVSGKAAHSFGDWIVTKAVSEFTVILDSFDPAKKIPVIKAVREITGLALGDAKALVESVPKELKAGVSKTDADDIIAKLSEAGGSASKFSEKAIQERSCSVCGYKETNVHIHTYSLTKDETHHWYAATCEHTTEVSGKAEHSFGEWTVTKEATEEAEGSKERTCTVCGYTATEAIEKLAHTHKFATDWKSDETNHWHASTCGHEVTEGKTTHTFGDWTITKEPTEEAEGSREKSCTVCEYTVPEVIEKLEHTHKFATDWTKDETNHWHASTCGHEVTEGKTAHTFGDWITTKEATEEAEGSREKSCTVCEYTVPEVIEKLEHKHKFATEWTSDETNHWHASTCGHEVTEGKTAHTFGDWITTKAATEEETGSKERVCDVCKYKDTEVIEKLEHKHKFASEWTSDETNHWHASTCGHDVTDSKAEHSFVNEVCTICEYSRIPEGFVLIPAGTFQMGSNDGYSDNQPVHEVTITTPFYIGKYEVTQAEYEKYCSYTGTYSPKSTWGDGDNYPAYFVSWYDALVYCNKRSVAEGLIPCYSIDDSTNPEDWGDVPTSRNGTWNSVECDWNANGYRLPTEAEWEYAARAGDNTVDSLTYSGTSDVNELGDYAWYYDSANDNTHEVGTKEANAFGLYDMSGNVWEWCWNWHTNSYDEETEGGSDLTGASSGLYRVCRGGGWGYNADEASVSYRNFSLPDCRGDNLGFRVVRASSN